MQIILCDLTAIAIHLGCRLSSHASHRVCNLEPVACPKLEDLMVGCRNLKSIDLSVITRICSETSHQETGPIHYLVGQDTPRLRSKDFVAHSINGPLPNGAVLRVTNDVGVCSLALATAQVMPGLDADARTKLVSMLCGTYSTDPFDITGPDVAYFLDALTTPQELFQELLRLKGVRGALILKRVLERCIVGSASSMETVLAMMLSDAPESMGYGIGRPSMNHLIPAAPDVPLRLNQRSYKGDLVYPYARLDIEYMGRTHFTPQQTKRDMARMDDIQALGYKVMQISSDDIQSRQRLDAVARQIALHLGIDLSPILEDPELQHGRTMRLARLLPPIRSEN